MKVRASVKRMCSNCKVIRRHDVVWVIGDNPKHKPDLTYEIAMDTLAVQQQHIAVPKRYSIFAREVWQLQNRLETRQAKFVSRLLTHKRFRAGFDFLTLRSEHEDGLRSKARWWHDIQEKTPEEQKQMIGQLGSGKPRRRKRRSRSPMHTPSFPGDFDPDH